MAFEKYYSSKPPKEYPIKEHLIIDGIDYIFVLGEFKESVITNEIYLKENSLPLLIFYSFKPSKDNIPEIRHVRLPVRDALIDYVRGYAYVPYEDFITMIKDTFDTTPFTFRRIQGYTIEEYVEEGLLFYSSNRKGIKPLEIVGETKSKTEVKRKLTEMEKEFPELSEGIV